MVMQKNKYLSHGRVIERTTIYSFLSYLNVNDTPTFPNDYPDCIVPDASLVIEETSIGPKHKIETLYKNKGIDNEQVYLKIKFNNILEAELISKIKNSIKKKDNKNNYSELLKYEDRILLVRCDGIFFDWRKIEIIAKISNFLDLELNIFNSVYLTINPLVPTKNDVNNNIVPKLQIDFIHIWGKVMKLFNN